MLSKSQVLATLSIMIQHVYTNMFDVLRTFGLSGAYFLLRVDFASWKPCLMKCRRLSQHPVQENNDIKKHNFLHICRNKRFQKIPSSWFNQNRVAFLITEAPASFIIVALHLTLVNGLTIFIMYFYEFIVWTF